MEAYLLTWLACVVGNFLYQYLQPEPDYYAASTRSFFQAVAIGLLYVTINVFGM